MHADATAASFAYIFGVDEAPHSGSFIIIIINLLSLYVCAAAAPPFIAASVRERVESRLGQDGMPLICIYPPSSCINIRHIVYTHTSQQELHSMALFSCLCVPAEYTLLLSARKHTYIYRIRWIRAQQRQLTEAFVYSPLLLHTCLNTRFNNS